MRWSKVLNVVECHAGGEVGKVVTGGLGDVPGETMFDKMFDKKVYLEHHLDDIRKLRPCADTSTSTIASSSPT